MYSNLKENVLAEQLEHSRKMLINGSKIKFKKCRLWRLDNIPSVPGVYAFFDADGNILYVGESGNLRERKNEVNRTVNHSFRRQIGSVKFQGIKSGNKFCGEVESQLDDYFSTYLYVSFIEVNFGRLEIETYIITYYQELLLNSVKKRKLVISATQ
ncbi:GIY-YIG nuclease family protein [Flavobacterium sp. D11R37]|uniref:GIY-YIG nuclease family protein n=1 Tax=Flavobacterium coralii TaxID=2838017 RepID=UPI001CA6BE1C|nr:GIY-YIG nuclease family protein [Flavobacterium coralii]MBY8961802.1 GIY-YIG nuclease family protein [Flavobacterium coralii]